jgi:tricarballylate dehydrogenase
MREVDDHGLVVVGCGMAGLAAGLRAAELGLDPVLLEKAPRDERGGQTRYVQSFRAPSADSGLPERGYEFDVPDYSADDFYDDIVAQTNGKTDPEMARRLVDRASETVEWLTDHGVDWEMEPPHVGYTVARTFVDGVDLVDTLVARVEELGGTVVYDAEARDLREGVVDGRRAVTGVEALVEGEPVAYEGPVVVAGGGYESDERKRTVYYGDGYDEMPVRGSPYNDGRPIEMALAAGAKAVGQWSGAHMSLIDGNSPPARGGANRIDGYQYVVVLDHDGERFVDEGQDARAHTYARFGRLFFERDDHEVFLVADARTEAYLWPQGPSEPTYGDTVAEVLAELGCANPERGQATVERYNEACPDDAFERFDPERLDGVGADLDPPKSNWAVPLAEPPYVGYPLTGGITFAFGGAAADTDARVLDDRDEPIPGLYAAGNAVGGLFYDNYPGGTALTNAAVYGRIAAETAAAERDPSGSGAAGEATADD